MKILARGEKSLIEELKPKFSDNVNLTVVDELNLTTDELNSFDVIFDLTYQPQPTLVSVYAPLTNKFIFLNSVTTQLAALAAQSTHSIQCTFAGINALPGFMDRKLIEVSIHNDSDKDRLDTLMQNLGLEYRLVNDRVGMVTPRVLFMIINEACYTLQEGTASMKDIDISMKLGTNYPMGPFEWADKIGIKYVYETLNAIYNDTHDERYKICPLLKTYYLKNQTFY